jgi:hypothetical protein
MIVQILLSIVGAIFMHWIVSAFTSPLRNIPGPALASWTSWWKLYDTYKGRPELTQRALHQKYGPEVRLAPNFVSLSDPSLIRTIYDQKGSFIKVGVEE